MKYVLQFLVVFYLVMLLDPTPLRIPWETTIRCWSWECVGSSSSSSSSCTSTASDMGTNSSECLIFCAMIFLSCLDLSQSVDVFRCQLPDECGGGEWRGYELEDHRNSVSQIILLSHRRWGMGIRIHSIDVSLIGQLWWYNVLLLVGLRLHLTLIPLFAWVLSSWALLTVLPFYICLLENYDDLSFLEEDLREMYKNTPHGRGKTLSREVSERRSASFIHRASTT